MYLKYNRLIRGLGFCCFISILLFWLLIQSVFKFKNFSWDQTLIAYLHHHPLTHAVFKFFCIITLLANTETVLTLLIVMLCISLWKSKARYEVALLIMSVGIAAFVEGAFKQYFGRFRPNGALGNYHLVSYSFPSGHAMLSVCFYGLIFYFLTQYFPEHRKMIQWIALLLAFFIGCSRFLIGVHYLSDVLGGYLVAMPILCFGIYLYDSLQNVQKR